MENLSFLVLLLCPLILVFMLFMMKGMHGKNNHSKTSNKQSTELQKNMNKLMEQNEQLSKEIESMKRSR